MFLEAFTALLVIALGLLVTVIVTGRTSDDD
jgi:hypothetical protein